MNTQHLHSEQQRMTKILLVDDHALFRSGLRSLLQRQEDFEIVGEAADGLEGIKLVALLRPDVVLMDIDMPVMNGKEALSQILSSQPDLAVMMLTVSEDGNDLTECMRIGARGYLLKNINVDFLLDSIRRAVDGDSVLSPEMTAKLVARLRSPESNKQSTEIESLTPRERETLAWLASRYELQLEAAGMRLACMPPTDPARVAIEAQVLRQVAENLVSNALKYARDGGELELAVRPSAPGYWQLLAQDRGPGIPAAKQRDLFQPFRRLSDHDPADGLSSGLGLSLARQIVADAGGQLWYQDREGGGACFVIELPQAPD